MEDLSLNTFVFVFFSVVPRPDYSACSGSHYDPVGYADAHINPLIFSAKGDNFSLAASQLA